MSSRSSRDPTDTLENAPTTRNEPTDGHDEQDATDVGDPHSRDDPETPGFIERVRPSTWGQWSVVFMIVSFTFAVILYVSKLYPPGYHNPWVLAVSILFAGYFPVFLFAREQGFEARSALDTVVVKLGSPSTGINAIVTTGKVTTKPGGYKLEKEVKRTTFGGFVGEWLPLEDVLPPEDLDLKSKKHRDPSEPAALELDEKWTAPTKTDLHGDVYVTDAADIDFDFESRDVDRRTTPPLYLDEGSTGMIISELEFAQKREDRARDEITVIENRLEDIRKRVQDEQIPELNEAMRIVDRLKDDTLDPRARRDRILREERESSAVREIDEQVDEEMSDS
jgi:hypothetical protein